MPADAPEVAAEMRALTDETLAMLRSGRTVPDKIEWWWVRRREHEQTPDYLGRVLVDAGLPALAARARMGHFDDFHAPAEVADGAEIVRLVAELRVAAREVTDPQGHPYRAETLERRRGMIAAIENAARRGEFDATAAESARWEAGLEGHEAMSSVAGAEGAIHEGFDRLNAAIVSRMPKVGRNDPCPCGSGLKWKRCHGA